MEIKKEKYNELLERLRQQVPAFATKIQPVFQALDWKWVFSRDGQPTREVPSIDDLRYTLGSLITEISICFRKDGTVRQCHSTGRVQVRISLYDNRLIGTLELVPESTNLTVNL